MAIYVFSLLVGYASSGVDNAQGVRSAFLRKTNHTVKYIFEMVPQEYFTQQYEDLGIHRSEMLSLHLMLTGKYDLAGALNIGDKVEELKQNLRATEVIEMEDGINLKRDGLRVATLYPIRGTEYLSSVNYYETERLIASEYYADRLLFTKFYSTILKNGQYIAELTRTVFWDEQGRKCYECLHDENGEERYIFPNGKVYTKPELMEEAIKKMNLTENDIIILDRPGHFSYVQPLFQYGKEATMIAFLHSGHYFERNEEPSAVYMNNEYYYWFKYSDKIDIILVSTEEQKKELHEKLVEYGCVVPRLEVVPTSGIDKLRYPNGERKKHSLVTVSRIDPRKKLEWIVPIVIEVHKQIPDVTLDIYGRGDEKYVNEIKALVASGNAESYIQFKGHKNVAEIYQNYEMYISASMWETLGLSLMEAISAGNAIVGLDVRYGNRLFIEEGKNGSRIPFSPADIEKKSEIERMIAEMANAVVEILKDEERLRAYQAHSYEIAKDFMNDKMEQKWLELIASL